MITIELDDELSNAIEKLAEREHKPVKQLVNDVLIGFLASKVDDTVEKQRELKAFFQSYQQDMTEFKFDREEANAR